MPVSPSSSVQRARRDVAQRLRELRLDANLTARALSASAGWHESKTSRIESAQQAPSDEDVRTWCAVCAAPGQVADLIAASRAADSMYIEWQRLHRTGLRHIQDSRVPLYEQTRLMRVYCSTVVPGLFQTSAYARALLTDITRFQGTPDDVEAAVGARLARNEVLRRGDHRFTVLIEESVLRYQIGDTEIMAGQLRHLLSVMSQPSVSLGIVPFAACQRRMWPLETFTVFDDERVHVELLSAQVTLTAPSEVAVYVSGYRELADLSVVGAPARALINAALEALD
ncbi:XRE family transcriptional regulator [Actinomadura sp. KC216]|uniref:helix-turn-helix domain-containing protein n=1 Tax=Actinomadura sp. KC216 TaxID=2530370 RepID=UPI0010487746|nr:helix-turn-helix transcriptional regulator [Actinomadura sp. KC216]TDB80989.1 XRE family transcriptional regulator [Actinomadura sp. KC216]